MISDILFPKTSTLGPSKIGSDEKSIYWRSKTHWIFKLLSTIIDAIRPQYIFERFHSPFTPFSVNALKSIGFIQDIFRKHFSTIRRAEQYTGFGWFSVQVVPVKTTV